MEIYDLNTVAGAVVLEIIKPQLANRYEKHYNVKAQSGLAVGDVVFTNLFGGDKKAADDPKPPTAETLPTPKSVLIPPKTNPTGQNPPNKPPRKTREF